MIEIERERRGENGRKRMRMKGKERKRQKDRLKSYSPVPQFHFLSNFTNLKVHKVRYFSSLFQPLSIFLVLIHSASLKFFLIIRLSLFLLIFNPISLYLTLSSSGFSFS